MAGLTALLGYFSAGGSIPPGGRAETDAATPTDATPTIKPNLDALNRVLAHCAAQSAAIDTVIAVVRG